MTPDRLWKAVERQHSKMLGGSGRTGPQGRNLPDVKHSWLAIESKERRTPIVALEAAMCQAEANAAAGTLPVAVFHWARQDYKRDIVCMRLGEFIDWFDGEKQSPSAKAE